jgi:hypothetical protein
MSNDSPDEVYQRMVPAGYRLDPFDKESLRLHRAALGEVGKVHPPDHWRYRRDGYSDADIDCLMAMLARFVPDGYISLAREGLTAKQLANWKYRQNRHVEIRHAREGRDDQRLVNAGEHPEDVAEIRRELRRPKWIATATPTATLKE